MIKLAKTAHAVVAPCGITVSANAVSMAASLKPKNYPRGETA
jgi:hypothetical protein